jgi:hexokinase
MADTPERGDLTEEIMRQLQLLFPADRMQRILEQLGLEETEEHLEYIADLISAVFTRGIEFGAVEVTAQEIEAGRQMQSDISLAHVDLP